MTTPATEEIIPTAEAKQRSNRELIQEEEKHASSALEAGGENHNDPQLPVPKYQRWRWILVLVAIYVPTLVYGLDNTIVANIQPAIVEDFGSVEKLTFVSVGFSLGAIALNLTV